MGRWLFGFLWKDVKLFCVDRQAVVMSFVVPVLIASILGWLDSTASDDSPKHKIPVLLVDLDRSSISDAVRRRLEHDGSIEIMAMPKDVAVDEVKQGSVPTAVILPAGFGKAAAAALTGAPKPEVELIEDPSRPIESQIAEGAFMEQASGAVASAVYGVLAGDGTAPLTLKRTQASAKQADWSRAAHDYAGFGLQGLLFFAMEAAVGLARERRQGIWKRLRAAPVPPWVFVLSRGISSTVMALGVILLIFAVGALLFKIRILGSVVGFFAIAFTTALMAATFGLMFSTVGKSETQSRALSILVILIMLATGGAWFPLERMPDWVQHTAKFLPVRWAVEGFDGMTWRGQSFSEAIRPAGFLAAFAVTFATVAILRFRFSREPTA